ncbi:MAG: hypothetical protein M3Q31_19200, partial [Actinomycetota bacterium]|nr:hypothetical protein [Actinomycetota bacterium]
MNPVEERARRRRRARRRLMFQRIGAAGVLGLGGIVALALAFGSHDQRPAEQPAAGPSTGRPAT